MLKILALHSFRTSGAVFKLQLERAGILKSLENTAEFVFVDAPHLASGKIPREVQAFFGDQPYYEWFTVDDYGGQVEFDTDKLERSLALVERIIREEGPFDGVAGFSQGALLASVMVTLQNRGLALQNVPPLKFCILFAGLKSRFPPHVEAFQAGKVHVPSLHIFGDRDQIRTHCVDLAEAFQDSVVIQHPRGHSIPALQPHQAAVLHAFVSSFLNVPPTSIPAGHLGLNAAKSPNGEQTATGSSHLASPSEATQSSQPGLQAARGRPGSTAAGGVQAASSVARSSGRLKGGQLLHRPPVHKLPKAHPSTAGVGSKLVSKL